MVQDVFQYCFKQGKVSETLIRKSEAHKQKKRRTPLRPPFQYHLI